MAFSKRMRIPVLFLLGMFLTPVLNTLLFRQILYPVPAFPVPAQPPSGFEEVRLPLPKGGTAHAWARLEPGARAAVVLLHGNGENLRTLAYSGILNDLADLGVSFLALDYPGYGRSTGRPSEKGNVAAALAGLEWLEERRPEARQVLFGWSLGAGVAMQAVRDRPSGLAGIVLASPWTRLEDVARRHFPGWLVRLTIVERYDSLAAAAEVDLPVLVVHGREDEIIPVSQGARLAQTFAGPHRWVEIPGAGHNDLLGFPRVWTELAGFLDGL